MREAPVPPPPAVEAPRPQRRVTPTPPVTLRRPPPTYVRSTKRLPVPPPRRVEPQDLPRPGAPVPPVVQAPIAPATTPRPDTLGLMASVSPAQSSGIGAGGGVGTGEGTGSGPGRGAGLGEGSGGGTGGGPFRPGSGIEPPRLLREVRPNYTEEGRRRRIEGEVDLEVVVDRDGRATNIRVVRGLGAGLDQQAVAAVRQWRFAPARRNGAPVDVVVDVSVDFRLR